MASWCGSISRAAPPTKRWSSLRLRSSPTRGGVYVFVIKRVKTGAESGANVVIDAGLSGGEQVIVDGLQGIRAGIAVRASPMPQTVRG
jgi:multidrug efflux pump subunit AcrA (membrane-fusion protein)